MTRDLRAVALRRGNCSGGSMSRIPKLTHRDVDRRFDALAARSLAVTDEQHRPGVQSPGLPGRELNRSFLRKPLRPL